MSEPRAYLCGVIEGFYGRPWTWHEREKVVLGMGALGLGRLITYIPHPVTTGFTAGIAVAGGMMYLIDKGNVEIRKVDVGGTGLITTFAGTPQTPDYAGDGGNRLAARLRSTARSLTPERPLPTAASSQA